MLPAVGKFVRSEIWSLGGCRSGPSSAPAYRAIAGNGQPVRLLTSWKWIGAGRFSFLKRSARNLSATHGPSRVSFAL